METLHRSVTGSVRGMLRLEGLVVLLAALAGYAHLEASWTRFALLFLVPDLSMLGYLASARVGAIAYNAGHSYVGPLVLAVAGLVVAPTLLPYAAIWVAHIGFDRALGYGLKYATAFGDTHLGRVGKAPAPALAAATV